MLGYNISCSGINFYVPKHDSFRALALHFEPQQKLTTKFVLWYKILRAGARIFVLEAPAQHFRARADKRIVQVW